jgi:hypothetical protein
VYTCIKLTVPILLFKLYNCYSFLLVHAILPRFEQTNMAAIQTGLMPSDFHLFSLTGILFSFGIFLTLVHLPSSCSSYSKANTHKAALYTLKTSIYNVYFHPLSHIPGPILARASAIPYNLHTRNGTTVQWIKQLHETYGDAVRVNPTEVSFISGETAWPDIYGFRTGKHKTDAYLKDRNWFAPPVNGEWHLIGATEADHSRMRRNLSNAFSDKALKKQEGLVQGFVDLLVQRLHDQVQEGTKAVDIMRWYNYTTFDVITDLTFGEPLYCLRDKE